MYLSVVSSLIKIFSFFQDDHSRVFLANRRADYINANYIDVRTFCFYSLTNNDKIYRLKQYDVLQNVGQIVFFVFREFEQQTSTLPLKVFHLIIKTLKHKNRVFFVDMLPNYFVITQCYPVIKSLLYQLK